MPEQAVVSAAVQSLWDFLMQMGESSSRWHQFSCLSDSDKVSFQELFHDDLALMDVGLLRSVFRLCGRWKAWADEHGCRCWGPSEFQETTDRNIVAPRRPSIATG